jgi:hypothetical protein
MPVSQNGYSANNRAAVSSRTIPGTDRRITVRNGPAGDLLLWFASQFHHRVEDIDDGQLDDWGYAERPIRGGTQLSNHASGTAIDLNAPRHPLGAVGTFSAAQRAAIRSILNEAQGCVRWGGDYTGRKDEMHFEIVASEARCAAVLAELEDDMPSAKEIVDELLNRQVPYVTDRSKSATVADLLSGANVAAWAAREYAAHMALGVEGVFHDGGGGEQDAEKSGARALRMYLEALEDQLADQRKILLEIKAKVVGT